MEYINNYFDGLFNNIQNQPIIAGYVISAIGLIMLIAVLLDADWMLEGGNGFFNIASISKHFGRTFARILMGVLSIVIIFIGLLTSWSYS